MRPTSFLLLIAGLLLSLGGCRSSARVSANRAADMTFSDNYWSFDTTQLLSNQFPLTAPQSTDLGTFFAQGMATLSSVCGNCRGVRITLNLQPWNLGSPPPPDHSYSQVALNHYVDGVKKLAAFIDSSSLDPLSKRDSLGSLQTIEGDVWATIQTKADDFASKRKMLIDEATQKVKVAGAKAKGDEMAALADTKQSTQALQAATTDYTNAAAALAAQYAAAVAQYQAYRALESDAIAQLTQIGQAAATADLSSMPVQQLKLQQLASSESELPEQLNVAIGRLSSTLTAVQQTYDLRVAPYTDFMTKVGLAKPDATSVALASLTSMQSYCVDRERRIQQAVDRLADGMSRRVTALIVQGVAVATQPTLLQAAQLQASADFIADVNARVAHLWQTLPQSGVLRLYFISAKYDEMTSLMQMQPLCANSPPAYMQTGCSLMQSQFSRAHTWLTSTAPSLLRIQATIMARNGVDATKTATIQAEVKAGLVRQAAFDEDVLLQATDHPVVPDGGSPPDGGEDERNQ